MAQWMTALCPEEAHNESGVEKENCGGAPGEMGKAESRLNRTNLSVGGAYRSGPRLGLLQRSPMAQVPARLH